VFFIVIYLCLSGSAANHISNLNKAHSWNIDRLMHSTRHSSVGHSTGHALGDGCCDDSYYGNAGNSLMRAMSVGSFAPPLTGVGVNRLRTASSVPLRRHQHSTGTKRHVDDGGDIDDNEDDPLTLMKKQKYASGSGSGSGSDMTANSEQGWPVAYILSSLLLLCCIINTSTSCQETANTAEEFSENFTENSDNAFS